MRFAVPRVALFVQVLLVLFPSRKRTRTFGQRVDERQDVFRLGGRWGGRLTLLGSNLMNPAQCALGHLTGSSILRDQPTNRCRVTPDGTALSLIVSFDL